MMIASIDPLDRTLLALPALAPTLDSNLKSPILTQLFKLALASLVCSLFVPYIFKRLTEINVKLLSWKSSIPLEDQAALADPNHAKLYQSVILGYSAPLTLGGLLTFPLLNHAPIYIARKDTQTNAWKYTLINIETADPTLYPTHRRTLNFLKTVHLAKKIILGNTLLPGTLGTLPFIVNQLYLQNPSKYQSLALTIAKFSLGLFLYCETGMLLKNYALHGHLDDFKELILPDNPPAQSNRGALGALPRDVLGLIMERLDRKACLQLSGTCRYFREWRALLERDKKYVQEHYHPGIVDSIGLEKLAQFPILDLKACWLNPGNPRPPPDWDEITADLCKQEPSEKKHVGKKKNHSQFQFLVFDQNGKALPLRGGKDLPLIQRKDRSPHTLIYTIESAELQNQPVRFRDPAGRHGIAFPFDCNHIPCGEHFPHKRSVTTKGVAILHQLNQKDRDGVWVLVFNMPVQYLPSRPRKNNYDFGMQREDVYEWFMFLHKVKGEPAPYCATYLNWLKKLMGGGVCGTLTSGEEHLVNNAPTFRLSRPPPLPLIPRLIEKVKNTFKTEPQKVPATSPEVSYDYPISESVN